MLRKASRLFKERFHIAHTTIQIENPDRCQEGAICDEENYRH
ncbi:hypothetical protein P4S95_13365 [Aneurinibacillus aneurinilyticus]|uniref:Uncharacterized protein n=1 Tax=Aneurinibacillus aneurinilyticus ATCC 12856 TaxID=649747 RepID=U1WIX9_ANEAE|nr:hypothetical protein [Aneurinibacillus aneurinilyticus]ERI08549.1 hypothetical protein HMPREF0083_03394 [Aneurinibacillus aneurinilyticus ATCC 12856]MED0671189.1 hypothetical protein [Aneurinibacillus aneurinilyticus]